MGFWAPASPPAADLWGGGLEPELPGAVSSGDAPSRQDGFCAGGWREGGRIPSQQELRPHSRFILEQVRSSGARGALAPPAPSLLQ